MPTVQHPAFPEITHEVSDDQLENELSAGWLEVDSKSKSKPRAKK